MKGIKSDGKCGTCDDMEGIKLNGKCGTCPLNEGIKLDVKCGPCHLWEVIDNNGKCGLVWNPRPHAILRHPQKVTATVDRQTNVSFKIVI